MVGVIADRTKYIFMAKINKEASKKSKVKKADSTITVRENN